MKKFFSALLTLSLTLALTAVPASALTLEEARDLLRTYYVDAIPEDILELDSLDEILEALGDPYTVHMTAEEYQAFLAYVNGDTVVGIGVAVEVAFNNGYQIMSVLPDSPAQEAGIEPGDRIISVDGVPLTEATDVQAAVTGEEGTRVTITVIRRADGVRRDYTLVRRAVPIPIVTYERIGNVGYINCSSFGSSTVGTIERALSELDDQVDVWILDLRSNPGGTVQATAGAAGLFAGGDLTMIYLRNSDGGYQYYYTTSVCPDLTDKPLIILTSAYSASGAEMFAGDARDYAFGVSVGQRTFGKGTAQYVFDETNIPDLFDGDAMKITTARFFSPDGTTNHIVGVLPTLLISQENTLKAAELLAGAAPRTPSHHLRLELGGFTFYVDVSAAMNGENKAAFTELLEALPPSVELTYSTGRSWKQSPVYTAPQLAETLGLDYACRYAFSDLEGRDEAEKIRILAVYDLVSGNGDGAFYPDDAITRAEFCTMLANALDLPAAESAVPFSDVPADAWYAGAVSAMYSRGFIAGCGDGTFRPDAPISYQEVVKILASAAAWISMDGYGLNGAELSADELSGYQTFAVWAQRSAWLLSELGVELELSRPTAYADRGQSAGLIYDLMDVTGLFWGV